MPKPEYTALDAAILAAIKHGCTKFDAIHAGTVAEEADKLTTNERRTPAFRIVDRRLQALRKKGLIRFVGRSWVMAETGA